MWNVRCHDEALTCSKTVQNWDRSTCELKLHTFLLTKKQLFKAVTNASYIILKEDESEFFNF